MATLHVFVTGPQGSGKSQFLASLGGSEGYSQDEDGYEYRHLTVDDALDVYLFSASDSVRADKLMEIPQRDLLGYIVLVDSTDQDSWSMARVMVANCRGYARLPMIIAANKQNLPGAASPEAVGEAMGLEDMIRVEGCNAADPASARSVFLHLLYSVSHEIERLDALIAELEKLAAKSNEG